MPALELADGESASAVRYRLAVAYISFSTAGSAATVSGLRVARAVATGTRGAGRSVAQQPLGRHTAYRGDAIEPRGGHPGSALPPADHARADPLEASTAEDLAQDAAERVLDQQHPYLWRLVAVRGSGLR